MARSMSSSLLPGNAPDIPPMSEMNTAPLIDVMLVLLIMFIITIPIQTHAVKVDLPQNSPQNATPVEPEKNKLYIDAEGRSFSARALAKEEFAKAEPPAGEKPPAPAKSSIHFVAPNVAIEQSAADAGGRAGGVHARQGDTRRRIDPAVLLRRLERADDARQP